MGIFSKNEPVILKEGSSAKAQLEALESLRGTLPKAAEKQLEADIRALRAGIAGEERILFELKHSHMNLFVIQDLYLEHEGLTAQIDFLVLTQQRYFVLECKNLYGNIEVNERGDFVRILPGRRREGMYSPVTQNQRHIDLIRAMRRDSRNAVENLMFDTDREFYDLYRSFVVLANPKTILNDSKAPKEVRDKIIRADRLIESMRAANAERGPNREKAFLSAIRKSAERFLAWDKGVGSVDYAAKYRELAEAETEAEPPVRVVVEAPAVVTWKPEVASGAVIVPKPEQAPEPAVTPESVDVSKCADTQNTMAPSSQGMKVIVEAAPAPTCPRCGAPMVLRTAKRGARVGKQFYGCSAYPRCRGIINLDE